MESGFFLRDNPNGHKDYECPELAVDTETMQTFNQIMTPVQMAVTLLKNDMVDGILAAVKVFI